MKKNNKGFMLAEVFIVSSFVLGVLVYMFIQINSIMKNYNRSFSYDTVQGLYVTNEVRKYINLTDSDKNIISGACANYQILNDENDIFWQKIKESNDIKTAILGNLNYIKGNAINDNNITPKAKDYINYLSSKDNCVLMLEFNDGTYASLNM